MRISPPGSAAIFKIDIKLSRNTMSIMNLSPAATWVFFMIFFNDLLNILDCPPEVNPDARPLTATGASVSEIGEKITENCRKILSWMAGNNFKLDAD
jgi:hypothetical protein